eukprot:gene9541-5002_t
MEQEDVVAEVYVSESEVEEVEVVAEDPMEQEIEYDGD